MRSPCFLLLLHECTQPRYVEGHTGDKQKREVGAGAGEEIQSFRFLKHHSIDILGLKWVANNQAISISFLLVYNTYRYGTPTMCWTLYLVLYIRYLYPIVCPQELKMFFNYFPMFGNGCQGSLIHVQCHIVYKYWSWGHRSFFSITKNPVPLHHPTTQSPILHWYLSFPGHHLLLLIQGAVGPLERGYHLCRIFPDLHKNWELKNFMCITKECTQSHFPRQFSFIKKYTLGICSHSLQ